MSKRRNLQFKRNSAQRKVRTAATLRRFARPPQIATGTDARTWFRFLRPRLLESRPVLVAETIKVHEKSRDYVDAKGITRTSTWREKQVIPAVYGKPTFKNTINKDGEHV